MALNDTTLVRNVIKKASIDGVHEAVTYSLEQEFAFGRKVVEEYLNYDTPEQQTHSYTYCTDITENGYGNVQSEIDFNGRWTHYSYDSAGRVIKEVTPFMDSPETAAELECIVVIYDYAALESGEDVKTDDTRWRTKITQTLGVETAREYAQYFSDREKHIIAGHANASFDDGSNRVETTWFEWYYDFNYEHKTRTTKIERTDGTSSEYSYADSSRYVSTAGNGYTVYTTQKTTVNKFQGNITSRSVEITNQWNTVEYSREYAPGEDGTELLVSGFDTTIDDYGRPLTTTTVDGDVTRYEYLSLPLDGDTSENPALYPHTRITAPDGTVTLEYYDTWNRKTYSIKNGIKTTYVYDANDQIVRKTITGRDGGIIETRDSYSADGQHISYTDECGNITSFNYGSGWETVTNPLGGISRTEYYLDGRIKKELFNSIEQKSYLYGVEDGEVFVKESLSSTEFTKTFTNFFGDEYKNIYGDNSEEITYFDSFGRLTKTEDSAGNVFLNEYEANTGKLYKQINNGVITILRNGYRLKDGLTAEYQEICGYFSENIIVLNSEETSRDGKTNWTFNSGKNSKTQKRYVPDNEQTATGLTEEIIHGLDNSIVTNLYINGVLTSSSHNIKGTITYIYDEFDRETSSVHPVNGNTIQVSYTYDAGSRVLTAEKSGDGNSRLTTYTYDAAGNKLTETSPLGITTSYQYDTQGNITRISGGTYLQEYAYNAQNQIVSLTVYKNPETPQTTSFEYDCRGRLAKKIYPDGNCEKYTYRSDGKIDTAQNCRGQIIKYVYNAMGLLSGVQGCGIDWLFAYDYRGMLMLASDNETSASFSYNAYGYPESESFSDIPGTEIYHVYDGNMRRISTSFGGEQVHYAYDAMSRLREVSQNQSVFRYTRIPGSDAIACTDAIINGIFVHSAEKSYSTVGELAVADNYSYTLDSDSRRTTAAFDSKTWEYRYDDKNQVISGILSDNSAELSRHGYSYDDMGNLIPSQFLRDADGNTLHVNDWGCEYDALNRLIAMEKDGELFRFRYDFSCRLTHIAKWNNGKVVLTKRFVYDGWNIIAEIADDIKTKTWLWGEDLSGTVDGAGGVGGLLAESNNAGTFIPTYDGNGNIVSYLNEQGNKVADYIYDPFGNIISADGVMKDSFVYKFSTKMNLNSLYYYGFRFYNPQDRVWITRDPIGENGGINLHGFVGNNAVNYIDFYGLKNECCNGKRYNPATQCCCNGEVLDDIPIGTNVNYYIDRARWYNNGMILPIIAVISFINGEEQRAKNMLKVNDKLFRTDQLFLEHAWLEYEGEEYGAYPIGGLYKNALSYFGFTPQGEIREEEVNRKYKNPKDTKKYTISLSPCKYNIKAFQACIKSRFNKKEPFPWSKDNNCLDWVNNTIASCKAISNGCGK